tara:strand:+ start:406 stop:939 length:534 start_codon:yes stop_codon:yes gene_type:complete
MVIFKSLSYKHTLNFSIMNQIFDWANKILLCGRKEYYVLNKDSVAKLNQSMSSLTYHIDDVFNSFHNQARNVTKYQNMLLRCYITSFENVRSSYSDFYKQPNLTSLLDNEAYFLLKKKCLDSFIILLKDKEEKLLLINGGNSKLQQLLKSILTNLELNKIDSTLKELAINIKHLYNN